MSHDAAAALAPGDDAFRFTGIVMRLVTCPATLPLPRMSLACSTPKAYGSPCLTMKRIGVKWPRTFPALPKVPCTVEVRRPACDLITEGVVAAADERVAAVRLGAADALGRASATPRAQMVRRAVNRRDRPRKIPCIADAPSEKQ